MPSYEECVEAVLRQHKKKYIWCGDEDAVNAIYFMKFGTHDMPYEKKWRHLSMAMRRNHRFYVVKWNERKSVDNHRMVQHPCFAIKNDQTRKIIEDVWRAVFKSLPDEFSSDMFRERCEQEGVSPPTSICKFLTEKMGTYYTSGRHRKE